jgi:hypothetical protein
MSTVVAGDHGARDVLVEDLARCGRGCVGAAEGGEEGGDGGE